MVQANLRQGASDHNSQAHFSSEIASSTYVFKSTARLFSPMSMENLGGFKTARTPFNERQACSESNLSIGQIVTERQPIREEFTREAIKLKTKLDATQNPQNMFKNQLAKRTQDFQTFKLYSTTLASIEQKVSNQQEEIKNKFEINQQANPASDNRKLIKNEHLRINKLINSDFLRIKVVENQPPCKGWIQKINYVNQNKNFEKQYERAKNIQQRPVSKKHYVRS